MSTVVFLGSTMEHDEARRILDATYLPPVAAGDVLALMRRPPRTIVIIDGLFEQTPAVWHKELLFARSLGVRVFGASSMGALRAAELASFGMEGVGRIFEMYRDGILEDDDEVAVAHASAEHGFRPISDAMVNLRDGLAQAEARSLLSATTRELLTSHAKAQFYADRSWATLVQPGAVAGVPEDESVRLRAFVRAERPDLKRRDAVAVLEHVRDLGATELPVHEPDFVFEASSAWRSLLHRETRTDARGVVPVEALGRHVRATVPERRELLRGAALLAAFAAEAARTTGREPATLAEIEAECDAWGRHRARVDRYLPIELERRGLLDRLVEEVRGKRPASAADVALTPADEGERSRAAAWYRERHGPLDETEADEHARELRFESWDDLVDEVAATLRVPRS